jgi:hypothetical protein
MGWGRKGWEGREEEGSGGGREGEGRRKEGKGGERRGAQDYTSPPPPKLISPYALASFSLGIRPTSHASVSKILMIPSV